MGCIFWKHPRTIPHGTEWPLSIACVLLFPDNPCMLILMPHWVLSKQWRYFVHSTSILVKNSRDKMLSLCLSCSPLVQDQYRMSILPLPPPFSVDPQYLVQIAPFPESKFPLDQCCACIAAVWRLARPPFPNGPNLEGLGPNLEGLVWPPTPHHHATPKPPMCAQTHTDTHFSKPRRLNNWCLSFWCIC